MNIVIENSAAYLSRAKESMRMAEETNLRQRALVHLQAADRWLKLAERARRIERASAVQQAAMP